MMSDMMWSDPDGISHNFYNFFFFFFFFLIFKLILIEYYLLWIDIEGWSLSPRGAGYIFGEDVVTDFNKKNNVEIIFRAH